MAQVRQVRQDSGLGFQGEILKTFKVAPSSLGSGACDRATGTPAEWKRPRCVSVSNGLAASEFQRYRVEDLSAADHPQDVARERARRE